MLAPQLWVWVGSPDDKLDVLRYVKATEKDILNNPIVQDALKKSFERGVKRGKIEKLGPPDFICRR